MILLIIKQKKKKIITKAKNKYKKDGESVLEIFQKIEKLKKEIVNRKCQQQR